MRVLHVVRQFAPGLGGLENFVLCLAKEQRSQGVDAEVLTLNTVFHGNFGTLINEDEIDKIPVHRVGWFGSYKYPIALGVMRKLSGYDIIHVHAVDFFADFVPIFTLFKTTPLVLSTHGGFFHSKFASKIKLIYFNTITRFTCKSYKRIIACSEGDFNLFSNIVNSHKLCLIENGVDIKKFYDIAERNLKPNFVFIGRFSDNKRLDLLLETFSHLHLIDDNVRLIIIGRDWDNNLEKLHAKISHLKLTKYVQIKTDLSDIEIKAYLASCCFVISASEYEGFGISLVEGMSAGLIPISSEIESFTKIISDANVGLLVNFNATDAAAKAINEFFKSLTQNEFVKLRSRAVNSAESYSWTETTKRFMTTYSDILGSEFRTIQGVKLSVLNSHDLTEKICNAVRSNAKLKVAFANAHTLNCSRNSESFRKSLTDFLVVNDGVGINLASLLKYKKAFPENLNGTDFIPKFLDSSNLPLRIYLLGSRPEIVRSAYEHFRGKYPSHNWVGYCDGFFDADANSAVSERIKQSNADILLVAMGNPKQELWISKNFDDTGVKVAIGVGALFDFNSGTISRAPLFLRRLNLEWLYRLFIEPRRMWKRYLIGNVAFLLAALKDEV